MERKGIQVIKDVASKTAGLVFFSLLAIALGVVFGVMFERWIGGEPGTPAATSGLDVPVEELATQPGEFAGLAEEAATETTPAAPATTPVKYRVRIGPYEDYDKMSKAAEALRGQGYPVLLASSPPYLVQVGAFANRNNALSLKTELTQKGYKAAVQAE